MTPELPAGGASLRTGPPAELLEREEPMALGYERPPDWVISKAQQKVRRAIAEGTLRRGPCFICGSTYRVGGHHVDYASPLDVVWLCPPHHVEYGHGGDLSNPPLDPRAKMGPEYGASHDPYTIRRERSWAI